MRKPRSGRTRSIGIIAVCAVVLFFLGGGPSDAAYGPHVDNGDGTISDIGTGLVWQQGDSGIQVSWEDACQFCDTLEIAGFDDWRLPRVDELRTLVNYQLVNPSVADPFETHAYFYWSVNTGAFGDPLQAWIVSFFSGSIEVQGINKGSYYTRCVRGGPNWPDEPSERFVLESEAVVIDTTTNLAWQRVDDGVERDWNTAVESCDSLFLDGYDDWRLPSIEELQTIMNYTGNDPAASAEFFDPAVGEYWSSTPKAGDASIAWSASFKYGFVDAFRSIEYSKNIYRRCVRGEFEIVIETPPPPEEPPPPDPGNDGIVSVDIKPNGCPNPLNVRSEGVLPVAVLGTETFDVASIDPASIQLEGVAPLRSSIEDVSAPADSIPEDGTALDQCSSGEPDGFPDLILKFETQAIVRQLGEVEDGEYLVLTLTGTLDDGTPIEGEDVVRIIKKGKPQKVGKGKK